MQDQSIKRFGSTVSILTGILLFSATILYVLWPEAMRPDSWRQDYLVGVYENTLLFRTTFILFAAYALLATGVVIAMIDTLPRHRALMRWISLLAIIGLAVMALNFWHQQDAYPALAEEYVGQKSEMSGFGLGVYADPEGAVWLYPVPGSPAEQAGIQKGDRLLAIDRQPVDGQSTIDPLTTLYTSREQGGATLSIQSTGGAAREIEIKPGNLTYWNTDVQEAIAVIGVAGLDPDYLFGFGLMGVWILVFNLLNRQERRFPSGLAWLGLVAGAFYLLFFFAWALGITVMMYVAAAGGLTLAPAWFIWLGIVVSKSGLNA